jgi:hypothetical protein
MPDRSRKRSLPRVLALAAVAAALATGAQAKIFVFNTDPFAGSTALTQPGRQIVGGELFIDQFDPAIDQIQFDPAVFNTGPEVQAFNGTAEDLPDQAFNFVVLRTLDSNLGLAGNQLAAGSAADLIAGRLSTAGAGFFVYFNSGLDLPRLVYSTDLSSPTADLKIVARFTNLKGDPGSLERFGPQSLAAVPEPGAWALMIAGFGLVGGAMRRSRRTALVA